MAKEIERKFLVTSPAWRTQVISRDHYLQGYLNDPQTCSVRVRIGNEQAYLNIKSATLGIERMEFEYEIPLADAREMLDQLRIGSVVEKHRSFVPYAGLTWEIDEFLGENAGLIVAEIELPAIDTPFQRPSWVGDEVSDDPSYYNVSLVKHPFTKW